MHFHKLLTTVLTGAYLRLRLQPIHPPLDRLGKEQNITHAYQRISTGSLVATTNPISKA